MLDYFRIGYAIIAILTLVQFIPIRHLYFSSSQNSGYIFGSKIFNGLDSNSAMLLLLVWISSLALIAFNQYLLPASIVNLALSYTFFVSHRWASLSRGFGAPGYITYWGAAALTLISFTLQFFPSLINLSVFLLRFDFAIILITAGVSKVLSGYPKNHGIQYGLVNPMWGYFPKLFKGIPPKGRVFQVVNHVGWIGQNLTAICLLFTPLNEVGGFLLALMFFMINVPVRLGPLCFMLMILGFLYQPPGGFIENLMGLTTEPAMVSAPLSNGALAFGIMLITFIIIRPFTVFGLWHNFYGQKRLPHLLQICLEKYTNTFGIILWRVFTADLLNFWVDIYKVDKSGVSTRLSKYEQIFNLRFNQVCESIAITCIFTSLKYYPDDPSIFEDRLKKFVRSLQVNEGETVEFRYYDIDVSKEKFEHNVRWIITTDSNGDIVKRSQHNEKPNDNYSSTKAGYKPGTYVPAHSKR